MISVIVPTLNERARLARLLDALEGETTPHEVIVVDGGSRDGTPQHARRRGALVLHSKTGRGRQLALGARAAVGHVLLFLHADCAFPPGGLEQIDARMDLDPSLVGGNFRLIFDGDSGFARWLTGFYAWFRRKGLYYGDSGIFARREAYRALGGIRPIALMEDYDFSRRLEKLGPTCCIEKTPLVTSSRKFAGRHPVSIFVGWLKIHALYHLGVSPDRLARIYYRRSG